MLFIEVTDYAVRSAVITLRRRGSPMTFVLFPMIHIGTPAFYADVRRRVDTCDIVVAEGVTGRSMQAGMLTMAYRFAPRRSRNGLVQQNDAPLLTKDIPVVQPDLAAAEVMRGVRRSIHWQYPLLLLLAPLLGLWFALRGPRAFVEQDLAVEDYPTTRRAEARANSDLQHALLDERDARLVDALSRIHEEHQHEPIRVAVVYGAAHMPAVVRGLLGRYEYRPRDSEWITVCTPR
ncbi:hypothetical protein [Streptacidiphilus jiangxiensis]|uniref:TraB family protein n=1 Tax=Streptacidiphilus jiangxiensis TaxID=235985 RepID=A0A1H7VQ57_STRJI|nr:hypothetical protein [Streptacidiphilus jiangxiensis]SEM11391.1 hypothetical protein SAMN05414137_118185 [Streptacidiphilus jiangxiensis]